MNNNIQPHDNSANYYDFVFQKRFGAAYNQLTTLNINKVSLLLNNGKVLDFGAGTGRLSIPLSEKGYEVTAIDISNGMLDVLREKAFNKNLTINCLSNLDQLSIDNIENNGFDLAISVFTVLAYITERDDLENTLIQMYDLLKPGGLLMFDLEKMKQYLDIFNYSNGIVNQQELPDYKEVVKIQFHDHDQNLCRYEEHIKGKGPNREVFEYREEFDIRFWDITDIRSYLENILGMQEAEHFNVYNADYYVFRK